MLVIEYHRDRQKRALERFKALGRSRVRADDKVFLKSIMDHERRTYKEHKRYIAEIERMMKDV